MVLSISSSSWCLGRAAVCDCGTPWTFLLLFFDTDHSSVISCEQEWQILRKFQLNYQCEDDNSDYASDISVFAVTVGSLGKQQILRIALPVNLLNTVAKGVRLLTGPSTKVSA